MIQNAISSDAALLGIGRNQLLSSTDLLTLTGILKEPSVNIGDLRNAQDVVRKAIKAGDTKATISNSPELKLFVDQLRVFNLSLAGKEAAKVHTNTMMGYGAFSLAGICALIVAILYL